MINRDFAGSNWRFLGFIAAIKMKCRLHVHRYFVILKWGTHPSSTFVRLSGWMIDFYDKLPGERTRASFFGAPQRVMGVCKFIYHTSTQKCWTAWLQLQHGSLESSSSYTCFFAITLMELKVRFTVIGDWSESSWLQV